MKIAKISDFKAAIKEKKEHKQAIKAGSSLKFALFDSINFVAQEVWNQIVPAEKMLMRHPYLQAVESSSDENHHHRYAIFYQDTTPVAVAIFNIIDVGGEDFGSSRDAKQSKTSKVSQKIKDKAVLRILICGNVHLSGSHGFLYSDAIDAEQAYHALAEVAYDIKLIEKRRGKIHIQLIKDYYQDQFESSEQLVDFKYRKFHVDPNMIVHIKDNWKSFDDYLAEMKAKYRKSAKSAVKKGKALERRVLECEALEQYQDRINELYENVAEKAKFRIIHIPASYFFHLKQNLGEDFEFLGYFLEDQMVGFTCTIFWGDNCEGHTIGLDYEFNNKYSVYQNILYDDIKMAIERGKKTVIFGRTAMEIKSGVGAEPADMQCFIRHPNAIGNKLLKPVFRHIKTSEWTQRSPFK